nr:immunoglobulin light chain junction region [Macaca mulatta]
DYYYEVYDSSTNILF